LDHEKLGNLMAILLENWEFDSRMEGIDPRELGFKIEKLVEVTK
jgi:hypothetical protein